MEWNYCPICAKSLVVKDGRPSCLTGHFTHYENPIPSTTAMVRRGNTYLFLQRAKEPYKGLWQIPGGFIELDETPQQAIEREIAEETALRFELGPLIGVFLAPYGDDQQSLVHTFECKSPDGEPKLSNEHSAFKWASLNDAPPLAFEDVKAAVATLKRKSHE
jgi:8-oxo-dGTP diphosphatase